MWENKSIQGKKCRFVTATNLIEGHRLLLMRAPITELPFNISAIILMKINWQKKI